MVIAACSRVRRVVFVTLMMSVDAAEGTIWADYIEDDL